MTITRETIPTLVSIFLLTLGVGIGVGAAWHEAVSEPISVVSE